MIRATMGAGHPVAGAPPLQSPPVTTLPGLRPEQGAVVESWFPDASLVADHSWDGAARAVLQLRHRGRDVVVKAGGPDDHRMDREI